MEKQWQLLNPDPVIVRTLMHHIECSPLVARLLVNRGVQSKTQATRFLSPSLKDLTPPSEMAGMAAAVGRIHHALTTNEKILVFGDYDTDGITATAVLTAFLNRCGARISYAIPHRIAEGYGMGPEFIENRAIPAGINLIITADCGSSSGEAITLARQAGIHTIVTDHHPIIDFPADAAAVVNPTQSGCPSNLGHLAGVGVAFYLIIALRTHLRKTGFWKNHREPNLKNLCDLVALGTVADVAPLIAENRALTATGLQVMDNGVRLGIAALIDLSGSASPIDTETIAFRLAPRLNAAGRLSHARMACELLLTDEPQRTTRLAKALCRLNARRQSMETELFESILKALKNSPDRLNKPIIVVDDEQWHEGILGIVASRLTRLFHRPSVVISTRNGLGKGSARSIDGIDLMTVLTRCKDLLYRFGGHPMAAGLSLPSSRVTAFRHQMEAAVTEIVANRPIIATLAIDAQVPIGDITPELMDSIEHLEPFGQGNPAPLLMDTQVQVVTCKAVGGRHRKMVLQSASGSGRRLSAIQFNVAEEPFSVDQFEKIAYRPQWNYWNGRKSLQLLVEDTNPRVPIGDSSSH